VQNYKYRFVNATYVFVLPNTAYLLTVINGGNTGERESQTLQLLHYW